MIYWSRRKTLIRIASVAVVGVAAKAVGTANALSASLTAVGIDSDFMDNQLREFFGTARGRYLPENVIYDYESRTSVETAPVYDQFKAIYFHNPIEYESVLPNGLRMIVSDLPHSTLKTFLFLSSDGLDIESAGMTFYRSPPGGVELQIGNTSAHFNSELIASTALFYKAEKPDPSILDGLRQYFKQSAMPREWPIVSLLGENKVRIKVYGQRLD
jgi:hypothetical protein